MGAPLFVFGGRKRGLNTEGAEEAEENPKSTARNGCATGMRKTQERAGQARPLQVGRINGVDRGADAGGGAVVRGGVSADGNTAL